MKQLFLMILLLYFIIDEDDTVFVKADEVLRFKPNSKEFHDTLEKALGVGIEQLNITIPIGSIYRTKKDKLLFVKIKSTPGYEKKFHGEFESLKAIRNTKTMLVPRPIATGHTKNNDQQFFAMEFMNLTRIYNKVAGKLGSQLADLHLHNLQPNGKQPTIKKFGFHVGTGTRHLLQNNTWVDDWITFFTDNRMAHQVELLKLYPERSNTTMDIIHNLWPKLKQRIPEFFEGIDVKPSLLHGDAWAGNVAESKMNGVFLDPASFYGHHEYDMAIVTMFGGYSDEFYDEYFKKIPKAKGYLVRKDLYQLFNYLNLLNNLEGYWEALAIDLFKKLINVDISKLMD